jgi:hypothetical protein
MKCPTTQAGAIGAGLPTVTVTARPKSVFSVVATDADIF